MFPPQFLPSPKGGKWVNLSPAVHCQKLTLITCTIFEHLHGGLICITSCLSVCDWTKIQTRQKVTRKKIISPELFGLVAVFDYLQDASHPEWLPQTPTVWVGYTPWGGPLQFKPHHTLGCCAYACWSAPHLTLADPSKNSCISPWYMAPLVHVHGLRLKLQVRLA